MKPHMAVYKRSHGKELGLNYYYYYYYYYYYNCARIRH
jgi:hypothetical protein